MLTTPPFVPTTSNETENQSLAVDSPEKVHVILTTRHLRLQSFSDYDQNRFTGAGTSDGVCTGLLQTCVNSQRSSVESYALLELGKVVMPRTLLT